MERCSQCDARIAVGGERVGAELFCGDKCANAGLIAAAYEYYDEEAIHDYEFSIHMGACPRCGGEGPNDMQTHYEIWSIIYLSRFKNVPEICCGKCGFKKKLTGFFRSFFFGWWSVPGLIITPIQLIRNFGGFFSKPKEGKVSKLFHEIILNDLGAIALREKACGFPSARREDEQGY